MASSEGLLYTLRKAGDPEQPVFELSKWDPAYKRPLDMYVMWMPKKQGSNERRFYSCNCPSRSQPCKHWDIAQKLLSLGEVNLPFYHWDTSLGEYTQNKDMLFDS
jgi:hypothetical protein